MPKTMRFYDNGFLFTKQLNNPVVQIKNIFTGSVYAPIYCMFSDNFADVCKVWTQPAEVVQAM